MRHVRHFPQQLPITNNMRTTLLLGIEIRYQIVLQQFNIILYPQFFLFKTLNK